MKVDTLKEKLEIFGIDKIIVVDDAIYKKIWELDDFYAWEENVGQNNPQFLNNQIEEIKEMNFSKFDECYKGSKEDIKSILKPLKELRDKEEKVYNSVYETLLNGFPSENLEFYECSEHFRNKIGNIDNKKIVFIDVDFGQGREDFKEIITDICNQEKEINFVVYSNENFDITTYTETKETLLKHLKDASLIDKYPWLIYSLAYVQKASDNFELDLIKQMRKNYKLKYLKEIKSSVEEFKAELDKEFFTIQNYEEKRHHFYLTEGMSSSEILEEIILNKFQEKISEKRHQEMFEAINKATSLYYSILDMQAINLKKNIGRFFCEYNNLHNLINGSSLLNYDRYLDLRRGDVLKFYSEKGKKFFIVLTQDCDMVIRMGSTPNKNKVHLIPIELEAIDEQHLKDEFLIEKSLKTTIRQQKEIVNICEGIIEHSPNGVICNISEQIREFSRKSKKEFKEMKDENKFVYKVHGYIGNQGSCCINIKNIKFKDELQVPVDFLNYKLHSMNINKGIRIATQKEIERVETKKNYQKIYDDYLSEALFGENSVVEVTRIGNVSQQTVEVIVNKWINHITRQALNNLPSKL